MEPREIELTENLYDHSLSVGSSTLMVRSSAKRQLTKPGLRSRLQALADLATDLLAIVEDANVPDDQWWSLEPFVQESYAVLARIQRRVRDQAANSKVLGRASPPTPGLANAKASFPQRVEEVPAAPTAHRRSRVQGTSQRVLARTSLGAPEAA